MPSRQAGILDDHDADAVPLDSVEKLGEFSAG